MFAHGCLPKPGCSCGHTCGHICGCFYGVPVGICAAVPCLTKVWLVSRRISQPSMIIRSMARFFRMFSVSLTSSCIILQWGGPEFSTSS